MIWTLVVADAGLLELAREWAFCGLVGRSLWIDPDDCSAEALAARNPRAVLLPDGSEVSPLGLMAQRPNAADTARILWCRRDAVGRDAERAVAGMAALQEALPGHLARVEYFDLVAPQPGALDDWPIRAPLWRTLIAGPTDAAIPGGPSELHVDDTTSPLLHLALVVGGVLGADPVEQPDWGADGAVRTDAVDVFSRVLTGGHDVRRRIDEFLDMRAPTGSALDLWPRRHTDERSARLVNDAYRFLRGPERFLREPGRPEPLSYREPPASTFSPREVVSAGEHRGRIRAFIGFLFAKSTPVRFRDWVTNELESLLGADDLGYDLQRVPDHEVTMTDYFELDAQLRSTLANVWHWEVDHSDGVLPDSRAWADLVRLTTGMVDGGPLPHEFGARPTVNGRTVAAPVAAIQSVGSDDTDTRTMTGGTAHAAAPLHVAGAAAQHVIDRAVPPPLVGLPTRGSRVTVRLAMRAKELSDEVRDEQNEAFYADAAPAAELPFLDRLRAGVLGDLLTSTLDAARLERVALGDLAQITPLRAATFWFYLGGGVAAALAMVFGFLGFQDEILAWLGGLGVPASPAGIWATISGVSGALVVGPVVWYYYHFQRYVERGRRQLEARCLLFSAALVTLREQKRLQNADRALDCWIHVLTALYPSSVLTESSADERTLPRLPRSLQVASPVPAEREVARWLVRDITPIGWRSRALAGYVSEHLRDEGIDIPPDDPLEVLCQDDGRPGGPLASLADQAAAVWRRWMEGHRVELFATLAESVQQECATVSPVAGEHLPMSEFFEEIRSDTYTPAVSYGHVAGPGRPRPDTARELPSAIPVPSSEVLRSLSKIYWRTLTPPVTGPMSDLREPETESAEAPPA